MAVTGALIGAVAAPVVGGIIGNIMGRGDRKRAAEAAARAYQEALSLGLPPNYAREIVFNEFKKIGDYTPELEQQVDFGISQVSQIEEDPSLRTQQMGALEILSQRGQGLGPEDRAALNQIRSDMARDAEAKRQQIIQNFQQRGMGGSGAEIAAQLMQAQSGANQASAEGDRLASMSAQNALEAISRAGTLGGQIRNQDFDVARTKASAADEFQRFNVQNQIARQQRNVASKNDAALRNLQEGQRIADTNTNVRNNELLRQRQAERDYWQDLRDRATLRSNASAGQASHFQGQANQTGQMWSGIGTGVGQGLGAYANYAAGQTKKPASGTESSFQLNPNNKYDYTDEELKKSMGMS